MPRLTRKGQVTIPQQIRSFLGARAGDEIIFEVDKQKVLVKKSPASANNFKKYVGFLSHLNGRKPDDVIDDLRGSADDLGH
jgi:AbrB family looped-hinge helix DNA binding protein